MTEDILLKVSFHMCCAEPSLLELELFRVKDGNMAECVERADGEGVSLFPWTLFQECISDLSVAIVSGETGWSSFHSFFPSPPGPTFLLAASLPARLLTGALFLHDFSAGHGKVPSWLLRPSGGSHPAHLRWTAAAIQPAHTRGCL